MKTKLCSVLLVVAGQLVVVGCASKPMHGKTPEERIQEDEEKLKNLNNESMNSGSSLEVKKVEKDLEDAKKDLAAEQAQEDAAAP